MAHLHEWEPGWSMTLPNFDTGNSHDEVRARENAVQNAQSLYKRHQKLKRARSAVEPLLAEVKVEIRFGASGSCHRQMDKYQTLEDLEALKEIREELIQQRYLEDPGYRTVLLPRHQVRTFSVTTLLATLKC